MNMNLEQFYQLSDDELVGTKGGFGLAEAVGIAGVLNVAVQIFNAGYKFGSDFARRGRQIMNSRNLNLNTLLPKLATIVLLVAIGFNLVLHVIRIGSLLSFDWQWYLVGLLASGYFGIFCNDLSKDNLNYK